jgi:hypothetical protein
VILVGSGVQRFREDSAQGNADRAVVLGYAQMDVALLDAQYRPAIIDEYIQDSQSEREQCEPERGDQLCDVCDRGRAGRSEPRRELRVNDTPLAANPLPDTPPPTYSKTATYTDLALRTHSSSPTRLRQAPCPKPSSGSLRQHTPDFTALRSFCSSTFGERLVENDSGNIITLTSHV